MIIAIVLFAYLAAGLISPVVIAGGLFTGWLWRSYPPFTALIWFLATPLAAYAFEIYRVHQSLVEDGVHRTQPNVWLFVAFVIGTFAWAALGSAIFRKRRTNQRERP